MWDRLHLLSMVSRVWGLLGVSGQRVPWEIQKPTSEPEISILPLERSAKWQGHQFCRSHCERRGNILRCTGSISWGEDMEDVCSIYFTSGKFCNQLHLLFFHFPACSGHKVDHEKDLTFQKYEIYCLILRPSIHWLHSIQKCNTSHLYFCFSEHYKLLNLIFPSSRMTFAVTWRTTDIKIRSI